MPRPISSLLLKPAGPDCNLACTYCFYRPAARLYSSTLHPRMTLETLRAVVSQYMALSETPAFAWQGGEPTLMGVDFYRHVVALQQKHGHSGQVVANSLQTNGVLVDDEWARLLSRYRFLVGLSLDGPADLHDHYRLSRGGEATHARVLQAWHTLRRHGVEANALCLVTARATGQATRLLTNLLEEGFEYLQFIPCVEHHPRTGQPEEYCVEPQAYGDFLCELFDAWLPEREAVSVRLFDDLLAALLGRWEGVSCTMQPECGDYVVVEHNGDVFCCDFFVDKPHRLGNLTREPLTELLDGPLLAQFAAGKGRLAERCQACELLTWCQGGCPSHRGRTPGGEPDEQYLCVAYQALLRHALPRLAPLAEEIREREATQGEPA